MEVAPAKQAMAVLKSSYKIDQDTKMSVIEEEVEDIEEEATSQNYEEEDLDFSQLNETTRDATNGVHFNRKSSLVVELDED
jgi:hypothetical protein